MQGCLLLFLLCVGFISIVPIVCRGFLLLFLLCEGSLVVVVPIECGVVC